MWEVLPQPLAHSRCSVSSVCGDGAHRVLVGELGNKEPMPFGCTLLVHNEKPRLGLGDWYSGSWTHSQGWEPHLLTLSLSLWTKPSSSAPCLSALGLLCQRPSTGLAWGRMREGKSG